MPSYVTCYTAGTVNLARVCFPPKVGFTACPHKNTTISKLLKFNMGCAGGKTVSNEETEEDEDETDDIEVPPKKSSCWQSCGQVKLYAHVANLANFLKDQGAEILGTANDIDKAYRSIANET